MELGPGPRRGAMSQINVTPFVDVMLVLLIIFMVTAPMMEKGVDVNLPEVSQAPDLQAAQTALMVSIDAKGQIFVSGQAVENPQQLVAVLQQMRKEATDKAVYLEADREVRYEQVMQVMAAIRQAGVERLGMVAQEERR
ncbi:protein TolR [Desulfuromonas thiophila]|uniref:Cell division and transport-associated protein TolR n=1 Tax=Desulfuromonas thiophila TaxID=57664 RepID=A0A1G7CLR5_9BACT|nr:protein TolR [Desulfuromonas thiophila]MCK9172155.1 protein TolR [Desulfuromonas thiophila]SDE40267.1 Cell division and transport-associated protein TolR [Desulfuromonas thiophila]